MELAIQGHNVIHAAYRKGLGWIHFIQGVTDSEATGKQKAFGIRHIMEKRNREHQGDATMPDGPTTLRHLPEVIAKGRGVRNERGAFAVEFDGWRAILVHTPGTRTRQAEGWLLSGFRRK